jgi:hypothetical protein
MGSVKKTLYASTNFKTYKSYDMISECQELVDALEKEEKNVYLLMAALDHVLELGPANVFQSLHHQHIYGKVLAYVQRTVNSLLAAGGHITPDIVWITLDWLKLFNRLDGKVLG